MLYYPFKRLQSTHSRLTPIFLVSISVFLFTTAPLLTTPDSLFPAIAQTTDARKTEADRLIKKPGFSLIVKGSNAVFSSNPVSASRTKVCSEDDRPLS